MTPQVTVGVASLCAERQIARCLRALEGQSAAGSMPTFEVVVAHNRPVEEIDRLRQSFPAVRFVAREGWFAPIQLMALACEHARGDVFMMTEDHCVPDREWVARLYAAVEGHAAAGGPIATSDTATPAAWAFYFLDFFRYTPPVAGGVSPALSVCNVAYRRADLEAIRDCWENGFHETAVHDRLRAGHGDLWMEPAAQITMQRAVSFGGAMAECYGQGRLFASKRAELASTAQRLRFLVLATLLPPLLLLRRAQKGVSDPAISRRFWPALPALAAMVLGWSLGEAMGYLTKRPPKKLKLAES